MKKTTILVCSNGFGHFRRCARVAYRLIKTCQNLKIYFICVKKPFEKLNNWYITQFLLQNPRIEIIYNNKITAYFQHENAYDAKALFDNYDWLPADIIKSSTFILSDNVSNILKLRPDTVLMGSFLWSEVLIKRYAGHQGIQQFHDFELDLLTTYHPDMICLKDMATPYVKQYTNPIETAWVVDDYKERPRKFTVKNILIMGGGTGLVDDWLVAIINQLIDTYQIFIPNKLATLLGGSILKKLVIFDFKEESFFKIDVLIARPGIGAVTDAIKYGIPILGIGELDNVEIQLNLSRIELLKFGYNITKERFNVIEVIKNMQDDGKYSLFQESLKRSPKNGLEETIDFLTTKFDLS